MHLKSGGRRSRSSIHGMNPLKRVRVDDLDRSPSSAHAGPSSAGITGASASAPRTPSSPPQSATSAPLPTRSSPRLPHTPVSLDSEQTLPETPWVNHDANGEKWFRRHQEWRKRGHPYELKAALLVRAQFIVPSCDSTVGYSGAHEACCGRFYQLVRSLTVQQVGGRENVYGQDVKFWSWVGPYRPTTDPPGGTWDDWEECLVISAGPRVSHGFPTAGTRLNNEGRDVSSRLTHSRSWSRGVRTTSRSSCYGRSSFRET